MIRTRWIDDEKGFNMLKAGFRHTLITLSIIGLGISSPAEALETLNAKPYHCHWSKNIGQDIKRDFTTYFKTDNLLMLGNALAASGLFANTAMDRSFRAHWQTDIHSNSTKGFFKLPNAIGGLCYWYIPIYTSAMAVGFMREHTALGDLTYQWGYRSIRSYVLASIQQFTFATALGNGRPKNGGDSKWQPFRHAKGVSGHAVIGAIPFLTAAHMTDPPLLRYSLYALSTLPGLARIDKDAHYFSQVLLGWSIAFLSTQAVYESDLRQSNALQVNVYPRSNGMMLSTNWQF
jgi:membrane-associated phospholipid phosphatase